MPDTEIVTVGDPELGSLIAMALRSKGYEVRCFGRVDDALGYVDLSVLPLVLLIESLRHLAEIRAGLERRWRPGHARLIVATGAGQKYWPRGMRVLAKPFTIEQLFEAIEEA